MSDQPGFSSLNRSQESLLRKGIDELNARRFFECHETLEELWTDYLEEDRELIQGIIQISVACYHLQQSNPRGAVKLLTRGLQRVERYLPAYPPLHLTDFVDMARNDLNLLEKSELVGDDQLIFPTIEYI